MNQRTYHPTYKEVSMADKGFISDRYGSDSLNKDDVDSDVPDDGREDAVADGKVEGSDDTLLEEKLTTEAKEREILRQAAEKERGERLIQLMDDLFNAVNNMNEEPLTTAFKQKLSREHRTLQQGFFRIINDVILWYAKGTTGSDGRNISAVKLCQAIAQMEKDSESVVGYLPFI